MAVVRTIENFRGFIHHGFLSYGHLVQVSMRMANKNTIMLTADKMAFVLLWGTLVKALRRVGLSMVEEMSSK